MTWQLHASYSDCGCRAAGSARSEGTTRNSHVRRADGPLVGIIWMSFRVARADGSGTKLKEETLKVWSGFKCQTPHAANTKIFVDSTNSFVYGVDHATSNPETQHL